MKPLPFKITVGSELEAWRIRTFWDKEPETIEWIMSFQPFSVFYDVGANIGLYSLLAASMDCEVVAIEPEPNNFQHLVFNVAKNADMLSTGQGTVSCFNIALGLRNCVEKLYVPDKRSGNSGAQIGKEVSKDVCYIPAFRLDDLCRTTIPKPTHLKIDTDGNEWDILIGSVETLETIESLLVEINTGNEGIGDFLLNMGFTTNNRFNIMSPHSRERRGKTALRMWYSSVPETTGLPQKDLLRPDEVAEYFDVHVRTIHNWAEDGKIHSIKIGGVLRIKRKSVIKLLENSTENDDLLKIM